MAGKKRQQSSLGKGQCEVAVIYHFGDEEVIT